MPGPAWDDDPPGSAAVIARNTQLVMWALVAAAPQRRAPDLAMAQRWHRALYAGVPIPSPSYRGELRDSDPDHPDLIGYEVGVGERQGVWATDVPGEVDAFIGRLAAAVADFDVVLAAGTPPSDDDEILAVARLAAVAHGEWVRIHPFANGNGRTARVWANWVALRYGLPPFVRVKPRPAVSLYGRAAMASMGRAPLFRGDHEPTAAVFVDMLLEALATASA